jgi:methylated-DNA-[protein]-cysteine S-methyltransferase
MSLAVKIIDSPTGKLRLIAGERGMIAIQWVRIDSRQAPSGEPVRDKLVEDVRHPLLLEAERQIGEYFAGARREFSVALDMRGTRFQKEVWNALLAIPFGETRSYGQLALELGNPRATRAVGAANGSNPLPIVVPCHRVIGSNGKLTGFGGGLETKAFLLNLETADMRLFP